MFHSYRQSETLYYLSSKRISSVSFTARKKKKKKEQEKEMDWYKPRSRFLSLYLKYRIVKSAVFLSWSFIEDNNITDENVT